MKSHCFFWHPCFNQLFIIQLHISTGKITTFCLRDGQGSVNEKAVLCFLLASYFSIQSHTSFIKQHLSPTLKINIFFLDRICFYGTSKRCPKPHKHKQMHVCLQHFGKQKCNLHFLLFAPSKQSVCFISGGPFKSARKSLPSKCCSCIPHFCTFFSSQRCSRTYKFLQTLHMVTNKAFVIKNKKYILKILKSHKA